MKVSELGEFGLIDVLAKMVAAAEDKEAEAWQQLVLGIGDDAAAWYGDNSIQLATVDALVQDVHFRLNITPWEDLGWKAMAANLSDIAAMGGLPQYALVSLALPGHIEVEDVANLYRGMINLARQFGVAIVGGNISNAPLVVINITILGNTGSQQNNLLTRAAARVGDKVAVTGYLGASAAGLDMLTRLIKVDAQSEDTLKKAFLHPYPRVAEGRVLLEQGVKTAMDISDGLVADLRHICDASKVGARIEVDRVPIHPVVKSNFGKQALELALSGGEDYELLFTASPKVIDKVKAAISYPVTVIGEITAEKAGQITLVDKSGKPLSLTRPGWEHFTGGEKR
jgi:thiamine-monophosphate kinase